MERLLAAVGAADQACEIRSLYLDLREPLIEPATPTAAAHAARPDTARRRQPERISVFWSRVTHADVIRAIEEYDRLGQEQFLAEHGFGRATAYLLIYRGRSYDSKAILGVAYQLATGRPLGSGDFSGGVAAQGAAHVLRALGFEIRNIRDSQSPNHR